MKKEVKIWKSLIYKPETCFQLDASWSLRRARDYSSNPIYSNPASPPQLTPTPAPPAQIKILEHNCIGCGTNLPWIKPFGYTN